MDFRLPFLSKSAASEFDPDQEKDLARRYKEEGDKAAYRQLYRAYRSTIDREARAARPFNRHVSLAQMKINAASDFPGWVEDYDPSLAKLHTHVTNKLRSLFRNLVREDTVGPHVNRNKQYEVDDYQQALKRAQMKYGENPTDEQVLEFHPSATTLGELEAVKPYVVRSMVGDLEAKTEDTENPLSYRDQFVSQNPAEGNSLEDTLKLDRIEEVMHRRLTPEEAAIVRDRLLHHKTLTETALDHGETTGRVRSTLDKWSRIVKEEGLGNIDSTS